MSVVGPPIGRRELAVDLRAGLDRLAGGEVVEQLVEALRRQVFVVSSLICTIGAFTQAPRHSTSSQENLPSAETWMLLVTDALAGRP